MLLRVFMNFLLLWISYVNGNKCNEGCVQCPDDNICTKCENGYFLKSYTNAAECIKCSLTCKTCSRIEDCLSCIPTFYGTKFEQSCSLCKNDECNNYGCVNGCKSGYYLDQNRYDICEKCSFRCTECTHKYRCSSCKSGWWGDGCRYSCTPCSQCVSVSCTKDCREYEYQDYLCTIAHIRCPDKCSKDFSGSRRDEIVSSTIQTPTALTTAKTTTTTHKMTTTTTATTATTPKMTTTTPATTTTTPATTTTTPTTTTTTHVTTTTTPTTTTTTPVTTTTTPTTNTTKPTTTSTTPATTTTKPTTTSTTPTPKPSTKPTTNRRTLTRSSKTPRPSTLATSKTFSNPRTTTPQEKEDTETTTQPILSTEGDTNISPKSQSDVSDTPIWYIILAVIGGVSVLVSIIVVVIYLKRRKRASRGEQVSSSPDTEEYTYAKQNKVRKTEIQAGLSNEMDLQRLHKDSSSMSATEQGNGQSNSVRSNATSHVTETTLGIDGIILETCLDESEIVATEANSSTGLSKGPTKATMDDFVDFWAMIWQDNVEKIVMLTKLMEGTTIKCEQYWPDIEKTISYGDVIVTNKSGDVYTDYTIRTLSVKKGKTTRRVYQAHFLSWPDKRVPETADVLLTLRDKVREFKSEMDGPLVVHCSAGVGRTGTYIAIDILLQQLTEEGAVDVFGCVIGIRGQRVAMVQTKEQYEFIHNVLVESLRKTK